MRNWRKGVFFLAILCSIIIIFSSSGKLIVRYSPQIIDDSGFEKENLFGKDNVECPGEYVKKVIGYGVNIFVISDDISHKDCLEAYDNLDGDIKTGSLVSAKNRAIEACKDSLSKLAGLCRDGKCSDCVESISSTPCNEIHDNKIEVISLAVGTGTGSCTLKTSVSAWSDAYISCQSETCAN